MPTGSIAQPASKVAQVVRFVCTPDDDDSDELDNNAFLECCECECEWEREWRFEGEIEAAEAEAEAEAETSACCALDRYSDE